MLSCVYPQRLAIGATVQTRSPATIAPAAEETTISRLEPIKPGADSSAAIHSMALEDQRVEREDEERQLKALARRLLEI